MLTDNEIRNIEYDAKNDYISSIRDKRYNDEYINGDIQIWTDADKYYAVPGSCVIPGDTIKEWIIDRFDSLIDEFLYHSGRSKSLDALAKDSDLINEAFYYDFVYDTYDDIEQYFWSSDVYQELCNEYFEEHGEVD